MTGSTDGMQEGTSTGLLSFEVTNITRDDFYTVSEVQSSLPARAVAPVPFHGSQYIRLPGPCHDQNRLSFRACP